VHCFRKETQNACKVTSFLAPPQYIWRFFEKKFVFPILFRPVFGVDIFKIVSFPRKQSAKKCKQNTFFALRFHQETGLSGNGALA
jgi:hypothetical protein